MAKEYIKGLSHSNLMVGHIVWDKSTLEDGIGRLLNIYENNIMVSILMFKFVVQSSFVPYNNTLEVILKKPSPDYKHSLYNKIV